LEAAKEVKDFAFLEVEEAADAEGIE